MTIGEVVFITIISLIPSVPFAFGLTLAALERKHKMGVLKTVEFSKHQSRNIAQYECSQKELDQVVAILQRGGNVR